MTSPIPNLFVVGAMRAGTTALHEVLGAHPEIFMTGFKEPAYFADPDQLATDSRVVSSAGYAGNRIRYLELFAGAGDATYRGESSTHYTKAPRITGVADRIAGMAPDARILYLMRDPIERTLSHYRQAVRMKYERRRLSDAVREEAIYCAVSDYARQIEPYFAAFGEDNVRTIVFEELRDHPSDHFTGLYTWLGVDAAAGRTELPHRNAVPGQVRTARGPDLLHRIGRTKLYQKIARTAVPSGLRTAVGGILNRPVAPGEVSDPDVIGYLHDRLAPSIDRLARLTGRTYDLWPTTGC